MSQAGHQAEIIDLDDRRRATAAGATRERCSAEITAGQPCRNYAGPSGLCRVHEPEPDGTDVDAAAPASSPPAQPEPQPAFDEAIATALAFLRRRLTGEYDVDVYGFDRELTEQVLLPLARPLYQKYW